MESKGAKSSNNDSRFHLSEDPFLLIYGILFIEVELYYYRGKHYLGSSVVLSVSLPLNSRSDWLLEFNEFKMAAGVVIRIQDGGPLVPSALRLLMT